MEDIGKRIGTFFIVLGVFLVILFVASDTVNEPYYPLICSGALLLGLGWYLQMRNRAPEEPKPSGRFGLFNGKPKENKADKKKS